MGFEPMRVATLEPESSPLDHSGTHAYTKLQYLLNHNLNIYF